MHHAFAPRVWSLYEMFPDITLYTTLKNAFRFANNGVEGFFIISGFFFVLTFNPAISFTKYILKKYIRLAPILIFATIICAIASIFGIMEFNILDNIVNILLLNNFFYRWCNGAVGSVWFVSALFACFVLFFLLKKHVKNKQIYLFLVFAIFIFGYTVLEILKHGAFGGPGQNIWIFNVGFLRALGGFGLGTCIGELHNIFAKYIVQFNYNKIHYLTISILEVLSLAIIIWWTFFIHARINNIIYVLVFSLLFILFINNIGFLSKLLNKSIWSYISKYVYSIFVCHTLVYKIFSYKFWSVHQNFVNNHYLIPVIINFCLVVLLGIIAYHLVEYPIVGYFKKKQNC